jgi:integrase
MLVQLSNEGKMAHNWTATKHTGIRYREHDTRKHGRQADKYFNVRFCVKGASVNEGYGWASEGMSASKAAILMAELKEELRTGKGTGKLSDRQKEKQAELDKIQQEKLAQERLAVTYSQFYKKTYLPTILDKKPTTLAREKSLHKLWILPALGRVPIKDIGELHIRKIKSDMTKAGRSPRTVQYAFACLRMVMNHAAEEGYYTGINPIKKLKKTDRPKFDNRRTRFLSHEEANQLLQALKLKSQEVHDMTLLSLHCGLRAGEIFAITWGDIDTTHGHVTVRETKGGKDRTVIMTEAVKEMFLSKTVGDHGDLVFSARRGKKRGRISKTFERVVDDIGFNDGVEKNNRKQKLTFHNCRHTCASWLAQAGVSLFVIKEILGHANIDMTMRYSHLSPDGMKAAVGIMEESLLQSQVHQKKQNVINIK